MPCPADEEGETHAERLQRLDAEVAVLRGAAAKAEAGDAKVRSTLCRPTPGFHMFRPAPSACDAHVLRCLLQAWHVVIGWYRLLHWFTVPVSVNHF